MFQDKAKIYIKSGEGGRGVVSFRREKFVPMGGPDGGDGGQGASIILRVDDQLSTLQPFRYRQHFRAENGQPGRGQKMAGKNGEDLYIDVPPGTTAINDETDKILADMTEPGETKVLLRGGKGGLGNVHFKSSVHQAPRMAELGEPGVELWIRLELKVIADVGLVGFPNAGKSTLLAAASAARPKIADYPFTTLEPNLGVVEVGGRDGKTFVIADIPGLIEGASEGVGLGIEFLRHVERTRLLAHIVDGSGGLEGRDPLNDFDTIMNEVDSYSDELANKPRVVVINKLDIPEAQDNAPILRMELESRGEEVFEISGVTGQGVRELMEVISQRLMEIPKEDRTAEAGERVYTLESSDERSWEAERLSAHHFRVSGVNLEQRFHMTDFTLEEAAERFQRMLELWGISAKLEELGVKPGDVVHVADDELVWDQTALDAEDALANPQRRRRTRKQRLQARQGIDVGNGREA
ncbi:MAG: GTPase ObgE [Chloroflexia bacterium]|nr:GTPase ObgE [Chloroflexia bacterium]